MLISGGPVSSAPISAKPIVTTSGTGKPWIYYAMQMSA